MSQIVVDLRMKVEFDSEDSALITFLGAMGYTLQEFLDDPEMVLDYIYHIGSETTLIDVDIPTDEISIKLVCKGVD